MSSLFYATRLWWDGRQGIAKSQGVHVELKSRPHVLNALLIVEIDYTPELPNLCYVHPVGDRTRNLTLDEMSECEAYLHRVATAALNEVERNSP